MRLPYWTSHSMATGCKAPIVSLTTPAPVLSLAGRRKPRALLPATMSAHLLQALQTANTLRQAEKPFYVALVLMGGTGLHKSYSPPMAGRPGVRQSSARTWENIRSANGQFHSNQRGPGFMS